MSESYLIIDSEGNLSHNNLHCKNNSTLEHGLKYCLEHLDLNSEKSR